MTAFDFKPLPEVYQVEVTTACQLSCPLCHRAETAEERGGEHMLNVNDLQRWIDRGDFAGSYYVELQMSGEPLLHPGLSDVASRLRTAGLLVGMSTNGLLLKRHTERLRGIDAITVSVDSLDPATYAKRRPLKSREGDVTVLADGIDALLASRHCPGFVDLQLVFELGTAEEDIEAELARVRDRWPDPRVTVRWVWDCFAIEKGRASFDPGGELCLNPWASVSVQSDGTVVSCCYVWGRAAVNVYGNLNEQALADIWRGDKVQALRRAHREGNPGGWCKTCYLRSPYLIHLGFIPTWTRRTR